jgi:SAM-dependent methyltransferase
MNNIKQSLERLLLSVRLRLIPKRARCFSLCEKLLSNSVGLEIGGPSQVFSRDGALPVYPLLKRLDNCDFSDETIWKMANTDMASQYGEQRRPLGKQYTAEATDLQAIPTEAYDCVLASHVIEHVANPLQALFEWLRVLKETGTLVLVVPHKDGTFDHTRPVTTLDHLLEDYERGVTEEDLTHLPEILELHDLEKDPAAGTFETFKKRSERNFENRALHHHVFDTASVVQLIHHLNLEIRAIEPRLPHHIIALAQKTPAGHLPDNQLFIGSKTRYRRQSPFPTDRRS